MKAIQQFLPAPLHVESRRIFVTAKPNEAWEAARHFDMSQLPLIRFLFAVRTFPHAFHNEGKEQEDTHLGIDQIVDSGKGFILLQEIQGREVIVGSVGKFWQIDIPFAYVTAHEFTEFKEVGWGKLAWGFIVEPFRNGSSILLELRISATDADSWRKLENYYRIIGIGSRLIRKSSMKYLEKELGKMKRSDDKRILAGDERIPDAKYIDTDHVVIEAPVSLVWRYLMQLGCDRAGWYSIDLLDNAGIPSVPYLVDDWTDRKTGDLIAATPRKDSFFEVYQVEHEKSFVVGAEAEKAGIMKPFKMSWAFTLEPIGNDATYLTVRARMKAAPRWAEAFMGQLVYPPVHGLMSAVQLRTIKEYAERHACRATGKPEEEKIMITHEVE